MLMNLSSATVRVQICPRRSVNDYILGFQDQKNCPVSGNEPASHRPLVTVTEVIVRTNDLSHTCLPDLSFVIWSKGNDRWLQMALDMVDKNKCDYVALLFYASWCPFSRSIRPSFDLISLLYPSVHHFAIEESSVRASTLSKYGVNGFPTIILLNSTMRVAYRGSRTLDSLVAFYSDVTGIEKLDETWIEKNRIVPQFRNQNNTEPENCPFPWARSSPENLLRQETYLTLATLFVLLRLLHLIFPTMILLVKLTWGRVAQNMRPGDFVEHTVAMYLKEPCMSSNLQEGAMNARAWASQSLATVSIGDSSSSNRNVSASQ